MQNSFLKPAKLTENWKLTFARLAREGVNCLNCDSLTCNWSTLFGKFEQFSLLLTTARQARLTGFDQLLLIFCLKVKLLKNNFYYTYSRWFWIFDQLLLFWQTACHVLASCHFHVDQFFQAIAIWAVEHLPLATYVSMPKFWI